MKLTQEMLEPDDEEKVKGVRGTTRVKWKSYRQGTIYISSEHKDVGRQEMAHIPKERASNIIKLNVRNSSFDEYDQKI